MRDSSRITNAMRRASIESGAHIQDGPQSGIVTSFDPVAQAARVALQPHGQETGYLPIRTLWAGPGWGFFAPPGVGSVVDVHFENGELDAGFISGRAHNDIDKPLPTPAGEMWMVHASGQVVKLLNNGTVVVGGIAGPGSVQLGNPATLHNLVTDAMVAFFNAHTHPANGAVPSQRMSAAQLTIEVKAS